MSNVRAHRRRLLEGERSIHEAMSAAVLGRALTLLFDGGGRLAATVEACGENIEVWQPAGAAKLDLPVIEAMGAP